MKNIETDFLVIGSGIAGLSYAIKIAEHFPDKEITVVTKQNPNESNTRYAQGGIAVVQDKDDSFEKHITDTLEVGDGLCDRDIVETVVRQGPESLKELLAWGVNFDINSNGKHDLSKEGGHSESRVVHHKDNTGFAIEKSLLLKLAQYSNIIMLSHHFVIDIINKYNTCFGANILDEMSNNIKCYYSKITLLATGGAGQVFANTTNPKVATGDGIAMANRTGAIIEDMEFIQFHPTALNIIDDTSSFLISEALRGFGARLTDQEGNTFMHRYDKRGDLASRDIVTRAIISELEINEVSNVFLDCRRLDKKALAIKFPNIIEKCKSYGIDVFTKLIPVVPAAHYICGGIKVDSWGQTSIKNLFACGECTKTGLHGANRLASNSLLEASVFANRCATKSIQLINKINSVYKENNLEYINVNEINNKNVSKIRTSLQNIMWNKVGIIRNNIQLKEAENEILDLEQKLLNIFNQNQINREICELRNLISIAKLIIEDSLNRNDNKGVFYKIDVGVVNI